MNEDKKARTFLDLLSEHHVDDVLEGETIEEILLEKIKPNPFQPRRLFDEEKINELAQSIKEHGIFQPIILKKVKQGYIIVSGERRFRAAQKVGLKAIPSIIRQYEESKVAEIALAENLQRENLTPIEEAEAYKIVMSNLKLTQTELAEKVGKSRSHVTNTLGLLNLPQEVQQLLLTNQISMGHARALSKLEDSNQIVKLAHRTIKNQLSVRQIEELTKIEEKTNKIKRSSEPKYTSEENELFNTYGQKVKIDDKKIVIYYKEDQLKNLIDKLLKK
ncbi:ParB/RepB/Spo0J family partition protein [Peloplasma aerotolerans]|uniref:ParB/RepB/Spo0J family partition protein n=1 Tax=Peloplasma aerotolerans TaxID=3044389 RepID=A0AAW6UDE5_9MOLU|nr:ParB/RepB/Spo0J family partition protein [Mariniplasma sp. M4Ah]MDI6453669.1 ParB/RepB/Spo0J family partition protein [Mariniplasma sp. M4Ah]MDR4968847.1 ParB/RepB/Spo0J family partition protein [Acholeplasmataceae bacterium]